ncbi:phosphate ABC transporter substrate-binding/OmpA family protein [Psychromonas algarum]|uniref:phosphate ABC transporter substrate-binding/OmpA family protein n=1 Tax=Psychromonas algarum TaxID=2555643 RepID=UPI0014199610|nr:phosphate ABC transporter substrate-binding/OmpA family protein [Psychromonas sp. RZ22]
MQSNNIGEPLKLSSDFKCKLVELKELVRSLFDIELSMDKLVLDEQYRLTVFEELSSLNNEVIKQRIRSLQKTNMYEQFLPIKPETSSQVKSSVIIKKHNKLLFITLLLVCIAFSLLVLIQSNVLKFTLNSAIYPSTLKSHPNEPIVHKEIVLPVQNAQVIMRLHGSNTIGESLAPALLEAYLMQLGITEMQWIKGDSDNERQLQYIDNNSVYSIEVHAHGSSTAFTDLLAGKADIAMSSREIKDREVALLKSKYGNLRLNNNEHIIGLDGVAIMVHPDNPLTKLTLQQISKIFSGEITHWSELGGEDIAIKLYARNAKSGTWQTFNQLALNAYDKKLSGKAKRIESNSDLSELVSHNKAAIGFVSLPYINHNKEISIMASESTYPIYPTYFTVSTEDYALVRRLYLYVPQASNSFIKNFVDFSTSFSGQEVVEKVGFISQNIKLETPSKIPSAPAFYNDYMEIASRLSLNFYFKSASNQLDSKGKKDISRVVEYIQQNPEKRIVLMGFSDPLEDLKKSTELSLMRANMVESILVSHGVHITAIEGLGEKLPIASNKTEIGRSKNRRVEVWVF